MDVLRCLLIVSCHDVQAQSVSVNRYLCLCNSCILSGGCGKAKRGTLTAKIVYRGGDSRGAGRTLAVKWAYLLTTLCTRLTQLLHYRIMQA